MVEQKRRFRCQLCGRVFEAERSEEETSKEMLENFGDIPTEERAVVCDDCYNAITIGGKPINFN